MRFARSCTVVSALSSIAVLILVGAASADDFYKNKQVKLIVGTDAGGSYDLSARLVARYLGQHIPGNPQVLVQNMPGAGSVIAANYVYGVAPQDGTVIVAVLQTLLQNQLSGEKDLRFDAGRLQWIGNPVASVNVIVTWQTSSVKTFNDARRQSVAIGVTSPDSSGGMEIALADNLLGTMFQAVTGYKGGNEIDIAMERGEVLGRAGQSWDGWKQTRPAWIEGKRLNVLAQIGSARAADLPDVPLLTELTDDNEKQRILALYSDGLALGRPLAVGPEVPQERVAILRTAFREIVKDEGFVEEARKLGVGIDPIYGEDLQIIVRRMLASPADVINKLVEARKLDEPGTSR